MLQASAVAQPGGDPVPDEPPPPEVDPVDAKARALYTEGETAYARGHYDEAVARFQEAYELSKRPLLLFNLANTFERMGAYADAAAALRRYIESPDATNVEAVRQRIRNLDARATEARELDDELATLRGRPPCPDPIVCPALPTPPPSNRNAYILMATGAVSLVAGGIFGLASVSAGGQVDDECISDAGGTFCPVSADGDLGRERNYALVADILMVGGAIAGATGAIIWWRNQSKHRAAERATATTVSPVVTPRSIGVGVAGSF